MKRSRSIRLVLIGGLTAGAAAGSIAPADAQALVSTGNVYTNDYQVPGSGFYHAPYRGWYMLPYNYHDPQTGRYFHGGNWTESPHQSITNVSSPTAEAVRAVQPEVAGDPVAPANSGVPRGGFGGTSHHRTIFLG